MLSAKPHLTRTWPATLAFPQTPSILCECDVTIGRPARLWWGITTEDKISTARFPVSQYPKVISSGEHAAAILCMPGQFRRALARRLAARSPMPETTRIIEVGSGAGS
jgi:hypothetical protein